MTNYLARLATGAGRCVPRPRSAAGAFIAPRVAAVPGGVVTFKLPGRAGPDAGGHLRRQAGAGGAPGATRWLAIVGIPLDTEPGEYHVDVQQPGGDEQQLPFTVRRQAIRGAAAQGAARAR